MKKLILILALALLLCSCGDAATKIGLDRFNWSQSLPIGANVTMNDGRLVDAKLGESSAEVTVGPYKWCDYVTDGVNDEVQIKQALATGKNVHLVGDLYIDTDLILDESKFVCYGNGPGRTVITENGRATIQLGTSVKKAFQFVFSNMEIKRNLNGESKTDTVGINYSYGSPFWSVWGTMSNLYVHGSDNDLVLGTKDAVGCVGTMSFTDCTFGPNPTDSYNPANRDNNSVLVWYGIQPRFTDCTFVGYNGAGILISNVAPENAIWITNCYVNGEEIGKYGIRIEDGTTVIISGVGSEASTEAQLYIGGGTGHKITQSFFGGRGVIGNAGQSARIVSDYSIVKDVLISDSDFTYSNGENGVHATDSVVEIEDVEGVKFQNCRVWDTGYGAINVTDSSKFSIIGCNLYEYNATYHNNAVSGMINLLGSCYTAVIQNNLLSGIANEGITVQGSSWAIVVTGNNMYGTNLGGDAISITTTHPETITNSTNYWITWA